MMKIVNKILVSIFVFLFIFNFNIFADIENDWIKMGGNNTNSKTISIDNPIKSKFDVGKRVTVEGRFKDAIIIKDTIYVVNEISKADKKVSLDQYDLDGKHLKSIQFEGTLGFFSRLTYDGKDTVFIGMKDYIQAVNIEEQKTTFSSKPSGGQLLSQLIYYDNYVYAGMSTKSSAGGFADGYYFAIDTSKDDSSKDNDILEYAWVWGEDEVENTNGFYWDGAVIVDKNIIFAGDSGQVVAADLKTGTQKATYKLSDKGKNAVRSLIHYDENAKEFYIGTNDTKRIFKLKLEKDKFQLVNNIDNKSGISGGMNRSSKGYLYVSSGGMFNNAISVYDNKFINTYQNTSFGSQSFPLINEVNEDEFVYFIDYNSGDLIVYNAKEKAIERIILPEVGNSAKYNSASVIAASDGTLVVTKNDGGNLYIIKSTSLHTPSDAEQLNLDIKNTIYEYRSVSDYKAFYKKMSELKNEYNNLLLDENLVLTKESEKVVEYQALLNRIKSLNDKTTSVKDGNSTYYYKFKVDAGGKWFNYKTVSVSVKGNTKTITTFLYNYSKAKMISDEKTPLNGSIIFKKTTLITKSNKNYKRTVLNYNSSKKIKDRIDVYYYKSKIINRIEKQYNKKQQLKSNRYGNAYKYKTYYKKGKAYKTLRYKYSSSGKLSKNGVKVKLRKSY